MLQDQRLVQTAVIGSAESEIPVLLPMRAERARLYRQEHAGDTFWCGRWLGGCSGRLTVRIPDGRVAHFAHVPGPGRVACRRTSVGVSGADHLYIKQQILAWLAEQDIAAVARLPEDAERLGSEVVFEPGGGHGCLRVLLAADAVPPAAEGGAQLLLGPHVAHDPHQLNLNGYVLRVRCDTDGDARRVMIGTQLHGRTEWHSLDACSLTPWGLSTPAVEEIRRLRSPRPHTAFPHRTVPARPAVSARPVAAPQTADDRDAALDALRTAVDGEPSTSQLRHCLTHADAATRGGASAEENGLLRRAADLLLARERGVGLSAPPAAPPRHRVSRGGRAGSSPAGKAAEAVADLLDVLDRRRGHLPAGEQQRLVTQLRDKAEAAGPWLTRQQRRRIDALEKRTRQAPAPAAPPTPPAPRIPVLPAAATQAPVRPAPTGRRGVPRGPAVIPAGIDAVADAARDVLEHAARLGATVSFDQLCAQVKGLAELSEEQQRRALTSASARSRRPLAALITTSDGAPHRHWARTGNSPDARATWQQTVADIHAAYRPGRPPPGARPDGR
ncbi:hypothetical protein ACWCQP_36755 [Streptomyces chartreusis]